mmetsp:Transcript_25360/g.79630  ORF Transcript_25360/g.79630 Transcript_25360/m.79630 type:complete len:219 (+) Transcript_25360:2081-2737(+)
MRASPPSSRTSCTLLVQSRTAACIFLSSTSLNRASAPSKDVNAFDSSSLAIWISAMENSMEASPLLFPAPLNASSSVLAFSMASSYDSFSRLALITRRSASTSPFASPASLKSSSADVAFFSASSASSSLSCSSAAEKSTAASRAFGPLELSSAMQVYCAERPSTGMMSAAFLTSWVKRLRCICRFTVGFIASPRPEAVLHSVVLAIASAIAAGRNCG